MIIKLKEIFSKSSLESVCLIVRPHKESLQVTVAPKGKPVKQPTNPNETVPEPKFAPFVCSGDEAEVNAFLAGGWVDRLQTSSELAKVLADQEAATKAAIEKAKKAEESAKKREAEAKKRGSSEDSKKLQKRIDELEKELEQMKAAPTLF